jgi:hypothetical protein
VLLLLVVEVSFPSSTGEERDTLDEEVSDAVSF